jgi:hypothetical protein
MGVQGGIVKFRLMMEELLNIEQIHQKLLKIKTKNHREIMTISWYY